MVKQRIFGNVEVSYFVAMQVGKNGQLGVSSQMTPIPAFMDDNEKSIQLILKTRPSTKKIFITAGDGQVTLDSHGTLGTLESERYFISKYFVSKRKWNCR